MHKINSKSDAPCANCGLWNLEVALVVCAALLIGFSLFSMNGLKELQRDKYRHEIDALIVKEGIDISVVLSRLVLDAETDRNPKKLKIDWSATKWKLLEAVGNLSVAVEADDKQRLVEASRVLHTFIYLFERRISRQFGAMASPMERDALKASLDEQAGMLSDMLCDHESALHKKIDEADAAYESKFTMILWLVAGSLLLVVWLVFRVIGESRKIDRALSQAFFDRR